MQRLSFVVEDDPAEDFLRWSVRTKRSSSSTLGGGFTKDFMVPFITCIVVVLILVVWLRWCTVMWPKMLQNEGFKNVIVVEKMEVKRLLTKCYLTSYNNNAKCFVGEADLLIRSESPLAITLEGISGYLSLVEPLTPLVRGTMVGLMRVNFKHASTALSMVRFKAPFHLEMYDDDVYMQIVLNETNPTLYLAHSYLPFNVLGETFLKTDGIIPVMSYSLLDPNISGAVDPPQ